MTDAAVPPTTARIASVRAELRDDTAFVATPSPRLSWTVETDEPGWRQASAELRSGDESVKLDGDASVLVAWPFEPLAVGERRSVQVRATAASGTATEWSDPLEVAAGFLGEGEWVAEPIGLAEPERPAQPALVRTAFTVDAPVASATLFYTALGVAEPELNGTRVDHDVLAPGWTSYRDRLVHETVDVTDLVREGENVLGATIAGAWYTEKYGFFQFADRVYGDQPSLIAQLRIEYADGRTQVVATGDGWRAFGDGSVVDSGIYAGEHVDLRRAAAVDSWSTSEFDASAWRAARRGASAREGYEHVPVPEARIAPPVRRIDELPVAEVITSPSGATILDFGQNLVGRLRITRATARPAPPSRSATPRCSRTASSAPGRCARPRRPTRYDARRRRRRDLGAAVHLPRLPLRRGRRLAGRARPRGRRPRSCCTATWSAPAGSSRSTTLRQPPARERGLGHARQLPRRAHRLPAARRAPRLDRRHPGLRARPPSLPLRLRGFLASWLADLAAEQRARRRRAVRRARDAAVVGTGRADGRLGRRGDRRAVGALRALRRRGRARDAVRQHARAGSTQSLELAGAAGSGTVGFQFGDWLDPTRRPTSPPSAQGRRATSSPPPTSPARARLVADAAEVLGEADDAARYSDLRRAKSARRSSREYVTPAGRMLSDAPTAYALALSFDLRDRCRAAPARRRRASPSSCAQRGYRIGTGFVGTPLSPTR